VNHLILALSVAAAVPLICRLTSFDRTAHAPRIAVLHVLLAFAVAWAGFRAWEGAADFGHLCAVLATMSWLWISFYSWRHGVPAQFHKRGSSSEPKVLDFTALSQAWGRGPK
jgi:hypothetical protein